MKKIFNPILFLIFANVLVVREATRIVEKDSEYKFENEESFINLLEKSAPQFLGAIQGKCKAFIRRFCSR